MTRTHMSSHYSLPSEWNKRSKKSSLLIFISSNKKKLFFISHWLQNRERVKHESLLIVLLLKWPEVSMDNQSCTSMPSEFILKVMHTAAQRSGELMKSNKIFIKLDWLQGTYTQHTQISFRLSFFSNHSQTHTHRKHQILSSGLCLTFLIQHDERKKKS